MWRVLLAPALLVREVPARSVGTTEQGSIPARGGRMESGLGRER